MAPAHVTVTAVPTAVASPASGFAASPAAAGADAAPADFATEFAGLLEKQLGALLGTRAGATRDDAPDAAATDAPPATAEAAPAAPPAMPWLPQLPLAAAPPVDAAIADGADAGALVGVRADHARPDAGAKDPLAVLQAAGAASTGRAIGAAAAGDPAAAALLKLAAERDEALRSAAPAPQAVAPQQTAATPPAATPTAAIDVPVHAPGWRDALGDRVVLLARERIQAAELHVTPPELGPVSVRIDVNGSEATIVFGVQQADTRAAVTDALPRLAELLAAQGLTLGGAQVGAELPRDRAGETSSDPPGGAARDDADAAARVSAVDAPVRRGLVDLFA